MFDSKNRRIFFSVLVLILCMALGWEIISLWVGIYAYQKEPSKERLLEAIERVPFDPDPYYRLGLFYLWDLMEFDLRKSKDFFFKAVERNPLEQKYWVNLAKVLYRLGEVDASNVALEKAIYVFPTGYSGRWGIFSILLERGDLEASTVHIAYLLEHYPSQSQVLYDFLLRLVSDVDVVLDRFIPKNPSSLRNFLDYLYGLNNPDWVKRAWLKMGIFSLRPERKEVLRYVNFMISHRALREAYRVWMERLREEGLFFSSDGNLITNPGFELREVLGGGFDWRMEKVSGAEILFDFRKVYRGKKALKVVFDGRVNVDFRHLYQYVAWEPNTEYLLRAYLKTLGLTTKSGVKLEVFSIDGRFLGSSEMLTGHNDWRELRVVFRTPERSEGGVVRLRREATSKFDRNIAGIVWLDEFFLGKRIK